jgi:DNA-binding IclR family transcriptional regulator
MSTGRITGLRVKPPGERRSVSRSAVRALDILEYFGQARRPLRAIEIFSALGLHPSTANQILKSMVESAHLVFDVRTKTYQPSHRLARFGAWVTECYGGGPAVGEVLQDVQAAAGEVVTLTTPNDLFMQILDLGGAIDTELRAERGLCVSVFGSAVGAAYLSTLSEREITWLATRARLAAPEAAEALADAVRVRRDGFAEGPSGGGVWSIATPLPPHAGRVPLVLGVAGPSDRVRGRSGELASVIQGAISRRLRPMGGVEGVAV